LNYISLAAALDNESANATRNGSVLTSAIARVFAQGGEISFEKLRAAAAKECDLFTEAARKQGENVSQHPMLFGNMGIKDIVVSGPAGGGGQPPASSPFSDWERQIDGAPGHLAAFAANKQNFRQGELLSLKVIAPQSGYLTIVNIAEGEENAVLIYPNRFVTNNLVQANQQIVIPGTANWRLPAGLPEGMAAQRNLFVAFLTDKPIDTSAGKTLGAFKDLGAQIPRSFQPTSSGAEGPHAAWLGSKFYVQIVK
jgi:hypothetical protein